MAAALLLSEIASKLISGAKASNPNPRMKT